VRVAGIGGEGFEAGGFFLLDAFDAAMPQRVRDQYGAAGVLLADDLAVREPNVVEAHTFERSVRHLFRQCSGCWCRRSARWLMWSCANLPRSLRSPRWHRDGG
jgi:hypothetical protein